MKTINTRESAVQDRIVKMDKIDWQDLDFIQAEDFKELPEADRHKLKASMLQNNFADPFKVWETEEGKIYCLDGKHRTLLLKELIHEGVDVPYLLPAIFIDCENKKEAAKLVAVYSAKYAKITEEGFKNFVETYQLDFKELNSFISLQEISLPKLEQKMDIYKLDDLRKAEEQAQEEGYEEEEDKKYALDDMELLVKEGDIFQLGPHRLACGSFTDKALVEKLMRGEKSRLVFTDPPYNLPSNTFSGKGKNQHTDFKMGGGEMTDSEFVDFLTEIFDVSKQYTVEGGIVYLCMDFRHAWHVCEAGNRIFGKQDNKNKSGNHYTPKQMVVWNKSQAANGSFYRAKHELVFIYKNGTAKHKSYLALADRYRPNVWDYATAGSYSNPDREFLSHHPTPKPVQMVADCCLDVSDSGEIVTDWFMGSGTTIMGAEATDRIAFGTEIEPKYIQLILYRYHKKHPDKIIKCENRNDIDLEKIYAQFASE